ncbi:hypothetical protein ACJIZ3_020292 [Penstemon smallii]|uniref:Protein ACCUMULATION AND REPLICATION OF CHLOROPLASTS 3 n=1 Tax=Penstemon smallii TaxID=265156 RepID=A0ABD3SJ10_9LAMI
MNLFYPNSTVLLSPSRYSNFPLGCRSHKIHRAKLLLRWNAISIRAGKSIGRCKVAKSSNIGEESEEFVDVLFVGSRKDSVLDFCCASPVLSPALRFWNILGYDSEQVQLQQRLAKQDTSPRTVEGLVAQQSSSKAVILVASAAYGSDHITALDVLSNVNSGNGLVVGIILKPFSFEGRRRQSEVNDLVGKLQKHANFYIVLDTDTLLENDLVTLDEALKTCNNAVLMAMNAISVLISEKHIMLLNTKHNSTRELQPPEFRKIFESYNEARLAFGAGYNVKTSLLRAINDCPFLGVDIKDLDGVIICIFASSGAMDCSDANTILLALRPISGWNSEVIVSLVHDPNLESNEILTTVIAFGYTTQKLAPRNGIFSSLGQRFPFIFNIFKKQDQQPINSQEAYLSESPSVSNMINSPSLDNIPDANHFNGTNENLNGRIQPLLGNTDEEFFSSSEIDLLEADTNSSNHELNPEGTHMFKRELLTRENLGSGHPTTEYSKKGTNTSEALVENNISIYKLPVGVKYLEKLDDDSLLTSNTKLQEAEWRVDDNEKKKHVAVPSVSWSRLTEAGIRSNVSISNKREYNSSNSEKQGGLSVRAASMLESERDSQKKWSRVVKMNYRGGIYRGRAQGGLPEGKGRLLLGDGSIYDGMWRYGKRSGLGTFYFDNGDVYQGSWRDDVMHGKGWIYFHTGDRWFVNFWKGKANGEGRFYSKLGDVFFGHFKDGWRHGHFLRIGVDGTRCQEEWDEGVLISEKQLDADAEIG